MKEKEPPWVRLPVLLLQDEELTLSDVVVLSIIIDRADATSCKLSCTEISQLTRISLRTVKKSVQLLAKKKYITVKQVSGDTNEYKQHVLFPKRRGNRKATEQESYIQSLVDSGMSLDDAMKAYAVKLKNKF